MSHALETVLENMGVLTMEELAVAEAALTELKARPDKLDLAIQEAREGKIAFTVPGNATQEEHLQIILEELAKRGIHPVF